jgi:hypothetical protein
MKNMPIILLKTIWLQTQILMGAVQVFWKWVAKKLCYIGYCTFSEVYFLKFYSPASLHILVNTIKLVHSLFFVYLVYLSVSICFGRLVPIIRKKNVFMRHLVLVILCGWLFDMHTRQCPQRITSTKRRINTFFLLMIGTSRLKYV